MSTSYGIAHTRTTSAWVRGATAAERHQTATHPDERTEPAAETERRGHGAGEGHPRDGAGHATGGRGFAVGVENVTTGTSGTVLELVSLAFEQAVQFANVPESLKEERSGIDFGGSAFGFGLRRTRVVPLLEAPCFATIRWMSPKSFRLRPSNRAISVTLPVSIADSTTRHCIRVTVPLEIAGLCYWSAFEFRI